jgi:EAL domain-containing protein (putative c-di-GMP-specific phosphodiesterase class I)
MLRNEIISFNKFNTANGTPENHIILEILENDNIEHYHLLTKKLVQFKQVAAKIAIDDFGSGYSNFSHIIGISPHYLKIDASLIKDIDTNRKSYEMVKAIVQFAKSLHIKTIAEFVSSKEIFDITYALGVDEFQGYYFGKPMSIEEIEAKTVADIAL